MSELIENKSWKISIRTFSGESVEAILIADSVVFPVGYYREG